ncbi:MAG: hypothetical protein AAGI71_02245 [Bacteroidota bacterium]
MLRRGHTSDRSAFITQGLFCQYYLTDGREVTTCFCRAHTLTCSYLGRTARRYDRALRAWAASQPDVTYVDLQTAPGDPLHGQPMADLMATDGFHPGPKVYADWGQRAARALTSRLAS